MSSSAGTGFQGGESGGKGGDSAAKARAQQKIKNKLDHLRYKLRKIQTAQVWQSWLRGLVGFLGAQGLGMSHPSWDDDSEKQFSEPQASCKPQQIDPTRRLALVRPGMSGKGPTFMVAEGFYLPANSHEQIAPVVELGSFDGMDVFLCSGTVLPSNQCATCWQKAQFWGRIAQGCCRHPLQSPKKLVIRHCL